MCVCMCVCVACAEFVVRDVPCNLQVLEDRGEMGSRHGRATFSVLLLQVCVYAPSCVCACACARLCVFVYLCVCVRLCCVFCLQNAVV